MKKISVCFTSAFLFLLFTSQNIYNDGTAWKMPRNLKTSDFYYDIENIYQYNGRHQEYMLKIKDFCWEDDKNENHIIESAFFIVKRIATGGGIDYAFQYRRYNSLKNEKVNSEAIRTMWVDNGTEIQRGATLFLANTNEISFSFGMPHRTGWTTSDGLYEKYDFSIFFERDYGPLLSKIINTSESFRFYFPSENIETNGFKLTNNELEMIRTKGNFVELDNNRFSLTADELEILKKELPKLMAQEKLPPQEYIERAKNELLK